MIGSARSVDGYYQGNSSHTQENAFRGTGISIGFPNRTMTLEHPNPHPIASHQPSAPHHPVAIPHNIQYSSENQAVYENILQSNMKNGSFYMKEKSSDENENAYVDDCDEHYDGNDKRGAPWHRIKWTDDMVKLLIDIVHSVGEENAGDASNGNKRKCNVLQKKGKWRLVSSMMNDRNCYVSPQQCEDKFNDLNKRYKRLNDLLGKEVALEVVDHPGMLDNMNTLSAKTKDDVRKILTSKHTFYKEMHSYYNGAKMPGSSHAQFQRPFSQSSVTSVGHESRSVLAENNVEGGDDIENERTKVTSSTNIEPPSQDSEIREKQWEALTTRMMELEQHKVGLQARALEFEKQHFKWQKANSEKDKELERLREENKRMKIENEEMMIQLKQKEIELGQRRKSEGSGGFL